MATVFWDSKGIIFIGNLEKGRTITGQCYDQLWGKFNDALKEEESAVAASQCAGTPIRRCSSEIGGLLPVSKHEKMAQ
jgi:hypothetical protein